jgi:hypothetical protein
MIHFWLFAWKTRVKAVLETRTYGTLLLVFGLGIPLLFGIALVVMVVTFSWTISADFAWTWGIVAAVVLLVSVGAVLSVGDRRRPFARGTRKLMHRATSGDRAAMASLAHAYSQGSQGLVRDAAQAAWWWRRLAEQGDREGAYQWGRILLRGEGVMKDSANGLNWIRNAAEAGHPEALAEVGRFQ